MAGRKPVRYLAPIALLATVAAVYLVVKGHVGSSNKTGSTSALTTPVGGLSNAPRLPTTHKRVRKFYTVKAGNTLSGIAVKTGVPVATILRLNPGVNPSALQTGQRLRLRR